MKHRWILLFVVLLIAAVTAACVGAPEASGRTYTDTAYGYTLTYPDGWRYTESGSSVAFLSPDGHEEMRITADRLSENRSALPPEDLLSLLNASYSEDFARDIPGTEWVSTTQTELDGAPAYESVYSIPLQGDERYTFVARYAVHDDVIYSVMYTEFPPEYDPYTGHGPEMLGSFRFV
ncbi:hypothetical protein FGU65_10200 [Methanoculleus sp. FWC-SCC1]|uniref:PsbP C-terminal domain-containing protein n=1 Tax=Methanoculleus frigidifontis TaxID=2584085 RepID=A0ABT8MBD4_9EURY|nr:hypothetical protein [Methanoculleus sp. FWC-SCC1]MDN7025257.1 hypothetical protein [Methanoculleus sp. FWC-SCC1]